MREVDVASARQIAGDLAKATEELCEAIDQETKAKQVLRDAEAALKGAEAEVVFEAAMAAQDKRGPLANLATTSKAYTAAIDALVWQANRTTLHPVADSVRSARARCAAWSNASRWPGCPASHHSIASVLLPATAGTRSRGSSA